MENYENGTNGATHDTVETQGIDGILSQVIDKVPGFVELNELELLHALSSESTGTVVELGSAYGRSTVALCLGAQAHSQEVVTVDAFGWLAQDYQSTEESWFPPDLEVPTQELLEENLAAFDVSARVIAGYSWEAVDQVTEPVGLLVHDADHSYEAVDKDLAAWVPKLADDAIIVLHDYGHEVCPGVKRAADEWAQRQGWHKGESARFYQVFRTKMPAGNGSIPVVTSSTSETRRPATDHERAVVQAYLESFADQNLATCMEFFTDDGTLTFLTKHFNSREEIEDWHRERLAANVKLFSLDSVYARGDTVIAEAVITSRRLARWRIKLRGRAHVHLDGDKIKDIDFISGTLAL